MTQITNAPSLLPPPSRQYLLRGEEEPPLEFQGWRLDGGRDENRFVGIYRSARGRYVTHVTRGENRWSYRAEVVVHESVEALTRYVENLTGRQTMLSLLRFALQRAVKHEPTLLEALRLAEAKVTSEEI